MRIYLPGAIGGRRCVCEFQKRVSGGGLWGRAWWSHGGEMGRHGCGRGTYVTFSVVVWVDEFSFNHVTWLRNPPVGEIY